MSRKLLALGVVVCLSFPAVAQINNTVYFMHGVPQSNRVNPAHQPKGNFYLGIPGLSPLRVGLSSSSLAYKDVIYPHPYEDSLITFLHPQGSKEDFLKQLKPLNFVASDVGTSLFSMGFRTGAGFFTLDVSTRIDGNIYYPGDLARLVIEGAGDGEIHHLDGIGPDMTAFDEIAVGWSDEIIDNLTLGVRGKVLFGVGNLSNVRSDLTVTTSQEAWNIKSDMLFNASLPFADVTYNEEGMLEDIAIREELENPNFAHLQRYMMNTNNLGFGIDLGVNYRPIDQLQLSVSLLDVGYIQWKDEVHQVTYATEYDFEGLEVNPFDFSEDYTFGDHLDTTLSQMADSLSGFLEFTPGGVYSKRLNTKLYVGGSYNVTPKINFGLLSRTDFLNGKVAEQVTASANLTTGRFINLTLSYSYMNAYFKNIGAGISFHFGPLNLYLVSDNALNTLFWPHEARSANVWFGLNLTFGYKEKMDHPMVN
ncbi:MAG: DUF5723 family protein [Bacteroidota bacterium]